MRPSVEDLLAQLPPLPGLDRPFFTADSLRRSLSGPEDLASLQQMLAGTFYDEQLSRLLEALPAVRERVASLGSGGLALRARPTNTINAVTSVGRDGAMIVFNLGFASFLHTLASALAMLARAPETGADHHRVVAWLAHTVDWATSEAAEPRIAAHRIELDGALAGNVAGRAQDFALCHELGHAMAESDPDDQPTEIVEVSGRRIEVLRTDWAKEHDADRRGVELHLEVLAHRDESPVGALIGAEVLLNGAALLAPADPDASSHPPPDDRLVAVRRHWAALVPDGLGLVGPAVAVREGLELLRDAVPHQVAAQREAVRVELERELTEAAARGPLPEAEARPVASRLAHHLLDSPGATLAFLRAELTAPRRAEEVESFDPRRLLAYNAGLHLEPSLRKVIGLIPPEEPGRPVDN